MLRANALERTGQVQEAVEQLVAFATTHPNGASMLQQFAVASPDLALCPQSFAMAQKHKRR